MGLLDDLLGGLAGGTMDGRTQGQAAPGGMGGLGKGGVLMALLPVVLQMLASRGARGATTSGMSAPGGGGGLGDILGQVLGGGAGGQASGGGLGDLLEQLQRAGFGEQADSWVSRGANQPIPADAMPEIFGRESIEQISRQAGISEDEASRGLSALLPEVVDRVTPDGGVPDPDALANSVDDLARRLGIR